MATDYTVANQTKAAAEVEVGCETKSRMKWDEKPYGAA